MATAEAGLELPIGLTEQRFMQQLARIEARAIKAAQKSEQAFVKSNQNITRSFGQMSGAARGQLQNVSYQLQDIFVQISSGQGAARALGQQLPQLLGGFGALGGALGLAAAAAIPLISHMMGAKEEAVDMNDAVKNLAAGLEALREAQQNAAIPIDMLIAKYGALADEMGRVFQNQLAIARQELVAMGTAINDAINSTASIDAMVTRFDALKQAVDAGVISYDEYRMQLLDVERTFGLTIAQALQYENLMEGVASASGPEQQAQAWLAVHDWIEASRDELEAQGVAVDDLLRQTNDLAAAYGQSHAAASDVTAAAEAGAAATDTWAAAAANLAANLHGAAGAAGQAAAALGALVAQQNALAGMELGKLGGMDQFSPSAGRVLTANLGGMNAPQQYEFDRDWQAKMEAAAEAARRAARGGGGGGRKRGGGGGRKSGGGGGGGSGRAERPFFEDIERDLVNLQRQIDLIGKSNEEVATAKARWELLDEAKKRGVPVNATLNGQIEAQAANVGRLTGELERAEIAQDQFEDAIDGIAGAMADALFEGESLREGLAQVFKGIAADILKAGIRNALMSQFGGMGGGGGFLGNLFGGLFGGGAKAPSFAGGGFTGYGSRSGGLDGRGGFPAILHPRETVIDHARGQRSGGGSMSMVIDLRGTTGDRELDRKMEAAGVRILAQAKAQAPEWMDDHQRRHR